MGAKILTTEEKRTIIGNRLKELLDEKLYSQAYLLHLAKTLYDRDMAPPQLNMIIKGKRSLPEDFAHIFSKILEHDPGYLCGMDEYVAESYKDFVAIMNHKNETAEDFAAFGKYNYLLNPLGYYVMGMSKVGDNISDYDIQHNGKAATIPAAEMDAFVKDVNEYINMRLAPLMKKYNDPDLVKILNESNARAEKLKQKLK